MGNNSSYMPNSEKRQKTQTNMNCQSTEDGITAEAQARIAKTDDPRLKQVLGALVRHMHAFVQEVEPHEGEWIESLNFLRSIGQKCEERGNLSEFVLMSDVLGVSSLVENIAHRKPSQATTSTVLGPFHIAGAPVVANGSNIAHQEANHPDAEPMYMHGTVTDCDGKPIAGAVLDVFHADEDGKYDVQQPGLDMSTGARVGEGIAVDDCNYRAKLVTAEDGTYWFTSIRPKFYPIPHDGPVGALLVKMNQHHMRPAHIHMVVTAAGCEPLITHIFPDDDPYVDSDVVYAVKNDLVLPFQRVEDAEKAAALGISTKPFYWDVACDISLSKGDDEGLSPGEYIPGGSISMHG